MITVLTLLVLAIAPGFFILWYIDYKDKYEKEPRSLIIKTFLLGAVMVFPAGLLEIGIEGLFGISMEGNILGAFIGAFLIVGPVEEVAKYFSVRIKAFRSPDFNSVMDGIVYGVSGAIGFATLENIFYVLGSGYGVGFLRAFLSVPGHAMEGAIIGYYLGMKKMNPGSKKKYILTGLVVAILFHGAYDFVIFTQTAIGVLVIPIIIWLYILFKKRLYLALKNSPFRQGKDEELYSRIMKKMSPSGVVKIVFGVMLLLFSTMIVIGSIVQLSEGVIWHAGEYFMMVFFTVVPTAFGILLFFKSRKNMVPR